MDANARHNFKYFLQVLSIVNAEKLQEKEFLLRIKDEAECLKNCKIYGSVMKQLDFAQRCVRSSESGTALREIQGMMFELSQMLEINQPS